MKEVTRLLLDAGATSNVPLPGPGRSNGLPMIVLACCTDLEAMFAEAGAVVDGIVLEYLLDLADLELKSLPVSQILACVRIEDLSGSERRAFARLSMHANEVDPSIVDSLLLSGVSPETLDLQTEILFSACKNDDVETVKRLHREYQLELDDLQGIEEFSSLTPLLYAAQQGAEAVLEYLLQQGVNLKQKCSLGRDALHHCLNSTHAHTEGLRILLEANIELNSPDSAGIFPVHSCVSRSDAAHFQLLLDYDADLSVLDCNSRSVAEDCDLDTADSHSGATPLHVAARAGRNDIVDNLLQAGCTADLQDKCDRLPIFYPTQRGHVEIVEKLKAHSTDRESPLRESETDFRGSPDDSPKGLPKTDYAVSEKSVFDMIRSGDVNSIRLLRESGWNIDSTMSCGKCTPLIVAILNEQHGICQYLLNHGASLEVYGCLKHHANATPDHFCCRRSETVSVLQAILCNQRCLSMHLTAEISNTSVGTFLHEAARYDNGKAISLLLDRGANPDARDIYLRTPLHLAAKYGSVEAVRVLLHAEASVNTFDDSVRTPSDLAVFYGRENALRTLYEREDARSRSGDCRKSDILTAAYHGKIGVVQYLVSKGESIYTPNVGTVRYSDKTDRCGW